MPSTAAVGHAIPPAEGGEIRRQGDSLDMALDRALGWLSAGSRLFFWLSGFLAFWLSVMVLALGSGPSVLGSLVLALALWCDVHDGSQIAHGSR